MPPTDRTSRRGHAVLFVCLGNICRSPTAEGVLRHVHAREAGELELRVDSAGTAGYHVGAPPDPRACTAALARGIDIRGLRARRVAAEDFTRFDLVLAMDRANLRDLARLRPRDATARLGLLMEYAEHPPMLEVPDPYMGDARDFEHVLDLVTLGSRGLIDALRSVSR